MSDIRVDGSKLTIRVGDKQVHECEVVDAKCSDLITRVTSLGLLSVRNVNGKDVRLWSSDAAKVDLYEKLKTAEVAGKTVGDNVPLKKAENMTQACRGGLSNYKNWSKPTSNGPPKESEARSAIMIGLRVAKASIVSAANYITGQDSTEHACGMNPTKLTPEQKEKPPLLLIHGKGHGPSAWIPLAKSLGAKDPNRPIFTVYLPLGGAMTSEADYKIIHEKMEEIKKIYGEADFKGKQFDIVGHSRGATIADQLASGLCLESKWDSTMKTEGMDPPKGAFKFAPTMFSYLNPFEGLIGKVIKLDCPTFHPAIAKELEVKGKLQDSYEIDGKYSNTTVWNSALDEKFEESDKVKHQMKVEAGHAGTLYSPYTHEFISNILDTIGRDTIQGELVNGSGSDSEIVEM